MKPIVTSALFFAALSPATLHAQPVVTGVGLFTLNDNSGGGASGLSDLAYDPNTGLYWAVNDSNNALYPLSLDLHAVTGAIQSGSIGSPLLLTQSNGSPYPGSRDQEGLTLAPVPGQVLVSYESSPVISAHQLSDGKNVADTSFAAAYPALRANLGFEALTADPASLWVANEQAMTTDGPTAGSGLGSTVRLTRHTSSSTSQFLYQTDGDSSGFSVTDSGLSGLLLLPDGSLLAMERALSSSYDFRIRLYLVDPAGATDILGLGSPTGGETFASKTLLWGANFPVWTNAAANNFEGLTLGPQLDSGELSLLLIADNDNSLIDTRHNLYALRILVPEPATAALLLPALLLAVRRRVGRAG